MKLCVDCAWFGPNEFTTPDNNLDKCCNPEYVKIDFVRGDHKPVYCGTMRLAGSQCGIEARGFSYNPGEPVDEGGEDGAL